MGKDKFENEDLIKHGFQRDIWFHVDDLSSAHVYLRLPEECTFNVNNIPQPLLTDCCQLTKHNSIDGNKRDNIKIVYTDWSNLKKTGDMVVGQVSFHKDHLRKFYLVTTRDNAVINRLNKSRKEISMDQHIERKVKIETELRKKEKELKRKQAEEEKAEKEKHAKEKAERDYSRLFDSTDMQSNTELTYAATSKKQDDEVNEEYDFM